MAFQMRLAEVIVKEGVVFESRQVQLIRSEVQGLFQDSEGFRSIEQPDRQEIAYLQDETLGLVKERGLGLANLPVEEGNLFSGGKIRPELAQRLRWLCLPRKCPASSCR